MSRLRQFVVIEGVALAALVAVAAVGALVALAASMASNEAAAAALAFGWFAATAIVGASFVVFMGAPVYWALIQRGGATWLPVLAAGAAPGIILVWLEPRIFGFMFIGYGVAVASLTHWWCSRLALGRKVT